MACVKISDIEGAQQTCSSPSAHMSPLRISVNDLVNEILAV